MGVHLLRNLLISLIASSMFFFSFKGFAEDRISQLKKSLSRDLSSSQVVYADQLLKPKRKEKIKLKMSHLKKADELYKKAISHDLISEVDFVKSDFIDLVMLVSYIKSKQKKNIFGSSKYTNIYVHPSDGILKIPVQFYDNKHVYVHFKNFDYNKKFGGYKTFSRSIDFDTGKIVASLVIPLVREKDKTNFLRELIIHLALSSLSLVLNFRDVGLYQGYRSGKLVHKLTFQTELYDGDLSQFYHQKISARTMANAMLQASKAVYQMHQEGFVHRDIKPANFFFRYVNRDIHLVLGDLGLSQGAAMPRFGKHLAGTRGYIDPQVSLNHVNKEWACRTFEECEQADIYSLGISFYSLIRGRRNTLKSLTYKINQIALPKDKLNPPTTDQVYDYLIDLKQAYQNSPVLFASTRNSGGIYWALEKLAWNMSNPEPKNRPSLPYLIQALEQINAGLDKEPA